MLKKLKLVGALGFALLFVSIPTKSAPIWGPWSYHHQDTEYIVWSGFVVRCWYVRYKLTDPNYRDAYRSLTLNRYSTECPATPPFTI